MNSAVLKKMLEVGLTLADAVELAEVWEAATAQPVPSLSPGALRTRKWRESKEQASPGDITVTSQGDEGDKDVSPTPPSENPSLPKGPLKGPQKVSVPSSGSLEKPKPKTIGAWTSEIWEITPRPGRTRSGKALLETALKAAIRKGHDPGRVKAGLEAYYDSPDATKNDGQYAQGVHVVINSGRWEAFAEDADRPPDDDPDPWRPRLLNWRVNRYWNSEWGPKPGESGYRGPSEPEARAA